MGNREIKNIFTYASKELSQDAFLRCILENYNCDDKDVCDACYDLRQTIFDGKLKESTRINKKGKTRINATAVISAEINSP